MSREHGRRSRWVWIAAIAVVVLAVGGGATAWFVNRGTDDGTDQAQTEEIGWETLLPGAVNDVFPGGQQLEVQLDANAVPILRDLFAELDPEGEHVGPPSDNPLHESEAGEPPARVHAVFDWDDSDDVEVVVTESWDEMFEAAGSPCDNDGCEESTVEGHRVLTRSATPRWIMVEQDDGEVAGFTSWPMPEGLTTERLITATFELDLPETDLTPDPPDDPMIDTAREIWAEHLGEAGLTVDDMSLFEGHGQLAPVLAHGEVIGAEYVTAQGPVEWSDDSGESGTATWGFREQGTEGGDDDCSKTYYALCRVERVGDDRVRIKWQDPASADDGVPSVSLSVEGPLRQVSAEVDYAGKPGTGTPEVPLETMIELLTDPRWQE